MLKQAKVVSRISRFAYWRLVWLKNVLRAAFRYLQNHTAASFRYVKNYSLLFYRLVKLGIIELKTKFVNLFRKREQRRSSAISLESFDYLSFRAGLLDFHNQIKRFVQRKRLELKSEDSELASKVNLHWNHFSLPQLPEKVSTSAIDATLIIHIYYLDIAVDMIDIIKNKQITFDNVIVTYSNSDLTDILKNLVTPISVNQPKLFLTGNYLRDVAPFLLATSALRPEGNVLKLHTKKSPHLDPNSALEWRNSLLEGLLPSADSAVKINNLLKEQSAPALYCPAKWISEKKQWGRNSHFIFQMCLELGITYQKFAPFPMGTMFWCNSLMLNQLLKVTIPLESPVFSERGLMDGTWPHAFERLPGQVVLDGGIGFTN